ncbi:SRPBCC family protein [Vibrio europaeus]|uniref:SRPBCC family protein n=1 Tax=Vibrio europaeus TaxID=300876 RepID=UPI0023402958|nr:SRPBCC family protein [Vibrio europaeus]MDC5851712.1 SRPBCC family protein [Vibrio europaeus]
MAHFTEQTITLNVPAEKVWRVLSDFSSVERFAPTIKSSPIVGDKHSGLGAKRLCTFQDGSSLVEEIIDFDEGRGFKMSVAEHSLPLTHMQAEMKVAKVDENRSQVYMSTEFVVKGGIFGKIMGHVIMRPVMKSVFTKVITGLAYHSETGKVIDNKLPSKQELAPLIR